MHLPCRISAQSLVSSAASRTKKYLIMNQILDHARVISLGDLNYGRLDTCYSKMFSQPARDKGCHVFDGWHERSNQLCSHLQVIIQLKHTMVPRVIEVEKYRRQVHTSCLHVSSTSGGTHSEHIQANPNVAYAFTWVQISFLDLYVKFVDG